MALECIVPLILDNTIPGTIEERGLAGWGENPATDEPVDEKYEVAPIEVYNLPFGLHRLSKFEIAKYSICHSCLIHTTMAEIKKNNRNGTHKTHVCKKRGTLLQVSV